jgi:hypothetical protein
LWPLLAQTLPKSLTSTLKKGASLWGPTRISSFGILLRPGQFPLLRIIKPSISTYLKYLIVGIVFRLTFNCRIQGMVCHGVPEYVIVNGRVCVDEEQLRVVEGYGRFIETPVYAPFVYDPDKLADLKQIKNGTHNDQLAEHFQKVRFDL